MVDFGEINASETELDEVGGQFVVSLYAGKLKSYSLDELHHLQFISPKHMPLERMAPTPQHSVVLENVGVCCCRFICCTTDHW